MNTHSIKKLLFCFAMLLAASLSHAQPAFPPTAYSTCNNCVPPGYTKLDNNYSPAISNKSYYGLVNGNWVPYNGNDVPPPPSKYSQQLGNYHHNFVSLRSFNLPQGNVQEKVQAVVSGFKPKKTYTFKYSVLSSALASTNFGKSAKMEISTGGQVPLFVEEQETIFDIVRNVWVPKTLTFTVPAGTETLIFTLSAGEMNPGAIGFVNFDIDNFPFVCNAGSTDAQVAQTSVGITCPNTTFDLTTIASTPPAGMDNVWYTSALHTEANKVMNPTAVPVGTYYLFRFDPDYECFNVQQSNSKVEVKNFGDISLKSETAANLCPETTVNLADQVDGPLPLSHIVRWFTTKDRSTPALFSPTVTTSGKYYGFLYNFSTACYYKTLSEDSVTVTINTPCCEAGIEQVKLVSNSFNVDCGQTANLTSLVSSSNNLCSNCGIVWATSKNHTPGTIIYTPSSVTVGTYYAFIYDTNAKCFNTDNSNAEVTVTGLNGLQVNLDDDLVTNECPAKTVNLHDYYSGNSPNGFTVVFYKTSDHSDQVVLSNVNTSGTYYAFYFNATTGCFTSDDSKAVIEVIIVDCTPCQVTGSNQVDLQTGSKINLCPATTVDLYSAVQPGSIPDGSEVVWYNNAYHLGTPLTVAEASAVSTSNTYYAFLHDTIDIGCYNTGISNSSVDVTINAPCPSVCNAGSNQVSLKPGPASNICPAQTVNLNDYLQNLLPPNLKYHWFTNANHNGLPIMNVSNIAVNGDYYAFIYDKDNNCYNTDNSNSFINVILQECKVFTNIKVKLQGPITGIATDMHNNLRTSGLLPLTDPYGLGSDSPTLFATQITDWVKVEIRSAANPATVLESKSFMLKTDGTLERYDGASTILPYFKPQAEPIHIVVKHRNHVAVMSKVISDFSTGPIDYDFTTSLQQCYNDQSAPDQMTEVNGVWCMSAGDLNGDETLDDNDNTSMSISFHQGEMSQYQVQDLNMDGVVDDVDISLFNKSYYKGLFSIITKY